MEEEPEKPVRRETKKVAPPPKKIVQPAPEITVSKDVKDDGPYSQVKKPKGAYIIYSIEQQEMMRKQNPHLSTIAITKMVGENWNRLDELQKRKYQDLASQEKVRYEREYAEETRLNGGVPLPYKNAKGRVNGVKPI